MKLSEELQHMVSNLPQEPGVYKFFNAKNDIIYIGKAKSLKHRVSSYFVKQSSANRKTLRLINEIRNLEYIVVNSEFDALLLENNLIKENQPKYNILLKDDKSYPYICVTNERYPRVYPTRRTSAKQHWYFGPYASVGAMNTLLDLFKQLFTLRTCSYDLSEENVTKGKYKVCLEYHIKNCLGPCEGLQDEADYLKDIEQVVDILKGNLSPAKNFFKERMGEAAAKMEFEKAEGYKRKYEVVNHFQNKSLVTNPKVSELEAYSIITDDDFAYVNFIKITNGRITQTETVQFKKKLDEPAEEILGYAIMDFRTKFHSAAKRVIVNKALEIELPDVDIMVPKIGDMKKLLNLSLKNALYYKKEKESVKMELLKNKNKNYTLLQLKADLNLKELPRHIECFDNSNIQGTNPVAAMVCFKDGKPSKKDYRHYKIKTVEGPDDFASMYEVVYRRYKRLKEEESSFPQLVVIDGGKGQLSAAVRALKELALYNQIPAVGIAKRLEEIYYPEDTLPLHLSKKSKSLELLQKLRNEAHRFAITFHRDLRSKGSLNSSLQQIEGVGPATMKKLLSHFKTINNMKQASQTELAELVGDSKAIKIIAHFSREM